MRDRCRAAVSIRAVRHAVVTVIAVIALVGVVVWWTGRTPSEPDDLRTREEGPVDVDGAGAETMAPIDEGSTRVAAIDGDFVVVSGGTRGELTAYTTDGDERWRVDLPFSSPLYQPGVAGAGDGLIAVTGIPCAVYDDAVDLTDPCDPGGVQAAIYDSRAQAWTSEPIVVSDETAASHPLGSVDGSVVVHVGASAVTIDLASAQVGRASSEASSVPSQMCVIDGTVAAVVPLLGGVVPDLEPGAATDYVEGPTPPVQVSVLDLDAASWTSAPPAPPSDHHGGIFIACDSDGLVVVSGSGSQPVRFDLGSGEWSELSSRPAADLPVAAAHDGARLVLFSGRDGTEVQVLQDGNRWTTAVRSGPTDPIDDVFSAAVIADRYAVTDRSTALEFGQLA